MARARLAACMVLVLLAGCQAPSDRPTPGFKPSTPVAAAVSETAPPATPTAPPPTSAPTEVPPTREPDPLFVINTGADGLSLRPSPGSPDRLTVLTDGTRLIPTGEEEQAGGRTWLKVRDPDGREGWVAAQFTGPAPIPVAPPPAPAPATAVPKPAATAVPAPAKPGVPTAAPTAAPSKPGGPAAPPPPVPPTAAVRATGTRAPSVLVATPAPKPAATAAPTKPALPTTAPPRSAPPSARTCCRTCRFTKACGDSCIAPNRTCDVGVGCACDAWEPGIVPELGEAGPLLLSALFEMAGGVGSKPCPGYAANVLLGGPDVGHDGQRITAPGL